MTTLELQENAPRIFCNLFCVPMYVHKIKSSVMTWQNSFAYWPKMKQFEAALLWYVLDIKHNTRVRTNRVVQSRKCFAERIYAQI